MHSRSRGTSGLLIAGAIVVIVVLGSMTAALAYRDGSVSVPSTTTSLVSSSSSSPSPTQSDTSTTSTCLCPATPVACSCASESVASSNVTDGLQLTATISPTDVPRGSNVSIMARVYNTLSKDVEVTASSMTNPADGPCQQGLATGVEVYRGSYTGVNLSTATDLLLYNPSLIYTCPEAFTFQYTFSPNSDFATIQTSGGGPNTTGPVDETSIVAGYWTGSGQNYTFQSFPEGAYTVVVFDAWGQSAIGHFKVEPQGGTSVSTYVSSSPTSSGPARPLTSFVTYGAWNYSASLSATAIQQGQNISAVFTLTNISNQTQRVDIVDPLVLPTIYSENGTIVWAYRPAAYNQVENITAGQVLSLQMVLPTSTLKSGQSYTLSTYPGIGTPGFAVDTGQSLQLNQTISVASTSTTSSSTMSCSTPITQSTTSSTTSSVVTYAGGASNGTGQTTIVIPSGIGINTSLNVQPPEITVVVGVNNTVSWIDQDNSSLNNVYFTGAPNCSSLPAQSPVMSYGSTFTVTLATPGTYEYTCQYHPWMRGTIVVEAP